jgi:hypothetical protein
MVRNAMAIIDLQGGGRFLSEAFPHEFPEGGLSETQMILWDLYYSEKAKNQEQ